MGVLNQDALDEAVAKAIAPLAQRLEDLEATVGSGQRAVLEALAVATAAAGRGRTRRLPWRRPHDLEPARRALPTASR